jgi:subtilisin-like proprotein convertase family protein
VRTQSGTALTDLDGEPPSGDWTLNITDAFAGDPNTLNDWALVIATGE